MPASLSQAWSLCEEWLLVEAERAMLRLIWDLDHCLPQINRHALACTSQAPYETSLEWLILARNQSLRNIRACNCPAHSQ